MKFLLSDSARADAKLLSPDHRRMFAAAAREFSAACDRTVDEPGHPAWPGRLRVKAISAASGVWEMT